jgi:hypothetical protein
MIFSAEGAMAFICSSVAREKIGTIFPGFTSDLYSKELSMSRPILFLLILSLLAACAPASASPQPLPPLEGTWSVKLTQSGGFAGLQRWVSVTSDGAVLASDDRAGAVGSLQLTPAQLADLAALVAQSSVQSPDSYPNASYPNRSYPNSGCADCFLYYIEIHSGNTRFSAQADDVTLPGSGLEPLVTKLLGLMMEAL